MQIISGREADCEIAKTLRFPAIDNLHAAFGPDVLASALMQIAHFKQKTK